MERTLKLLGKRIAKIRQEQGLTQEKLAEIINYSTNHISKLESARTKPSFEILFELAKAFNLEMQDLFNFDEYKTNEELVNEVKEVLNLKNKKDITLLYKLYKAAKY